MHLSDYLKVSNQSLLPFLSKLESSFVALYFQSNCTFILQLRKGGKYQSHPFCLSTKGQSQRTPCSLNNSISRASDRFSLSYTLRSVNFEIDIGRRKW